MDENTGEGSTAVGTQPPFAAVGMFGTPALQPAAPAAESASRP